MADYQSTLTGLQMDDALSQMNQRMPEQWTTGQIDGVDVPSTNPRYHNNAKYYSQQASESAEIAEQSAEDIEDLTVSSTTLPSGSSATVTKTHPTGQPFNLAFGIPKGDTGANGADGEDGEDGVSPTLSSSKSGKVTTVYYTDATHPSPTVLATINDGADGQGSGDMLKATYDTNNNGIVDNSEKLGGQLPSYYAKATDIPTVPTNVSAFTNDAGYITSSYHDSTKQDALPTVTNDRYLHTNSSTGALEWSEVQGGGGTTGTIASGQSISTSVSGYGDFAYKCDITVSGVTSAKYCIISFGATDSVCGKIAPFCETGTNTITIFATESYTTVDAIAYVLV